MPSLAIALLAGILVAAAGQDPASSGPDRHQAPFSAIRPTMPRPEALELPFERLGWPTLSPDGRMIAFTALDETNHAHIYVAPASGGTPIPVTSGPWDDRSPSFSSDGAFMAFVSDRSGNSDIWTVPIAGGEPIQVTDDPGVDADPAISPDGMRIAFASNRSGAFLLYTFGPGGLSPPDGGGRTGQAPGLVGGRKPDRLRVEPERQAPRLGHSVGRRRGEACRNGPCPRASSDLVGGRPHAPRPRAAEQATSPRFLRAGS